MKNKFKLLIWILFCLLFSLIILDLLLILLNFNKFNNNSFNELNQTSEYNETSNEFNQTVSLSSSFCKCKKLSNNYNIKSRIINGTQVDNKNLPFIASIFIKSDNYSQLFIKDYYKGVIFICTAVSSHFNLIN